MSRFIDGALYYIKCRLNAYVSGYVTQDEMRDYVNAWSKEGLVSHDVFERLSFYLK